MKVTTVSANIRYSQDTGKGAWKVVELGAEASVDTQEDWHTAQVSLYQQLGQQLKALWGQGNGQKANGEANPPSGVAGPDRNEPEPPQTPPHYCQEHQTEYKRYEKDGRIWYSHKTKDGKWCREKA